MCTKRASNSCGVIQACLYYAETLRLYKALQSCVLSLNPEPNHYTRYIRKIKQYVSHHTRAAKSAYTDIGEKNLDAVRQSSVTRSNKEINQDKGNGERRKGARVCTQPSLFFVLAQGCWVSASRHNTVQSSTERLAVCRNP